MAIEDRPDVQRMLALFSEDGTEVRQQLIYAGLLLLIFERFKRYIVDHVDGYYADHVEIRNGEFHYTRGEKFKKMIKEKGGYKAGQHSNREFRAALHWFFDLGAVTQKEFDEIERLYTLRNEIGHELLQILADHHKTPITLSDILTTFQVYLKITQWWWKEVEGTTDPDFDQEKYDHTDWNSVESLDTTFLREIIDKGLAGMPEWDAFQAILAQQKSKL